MLMNSSKMLFSMTMLLGILISTSASNWIMVWCGLEMSLISFIPLMMNKLVLSSESTMKYFIIQSISSSMLMLGMLIMIMKGDYNYDYILMAAMLIKTGISPFHTWVLTVLEGLDLNMILVMLSVNKIAPITLMSYIMNKMSMIIMITVIVGAIFSLNQNSIKKMLGYSSIYNAGFILSVLTLNPMWTFYLMVYSIMLMMLILLLNVNKIKYLNQMVFSETTSNKMSIWISLLSMGGMPPLLGFSIKYMVMCYLISMKLITCISIMLMSSLMIMFLYLRMTFLALMNNSMTNKIKMFNSNEMSVWTICMNTTMLPLMLLMKTLI